MRLSFDKCKGMKGSDYDNCVYTTTAGLMQENSSELKQNIRNRSKLRKMAVMFYMSTGDDSLLKQADKLETDIKFIMENQERYYVR